MLAGLTPLHLNKEIKKLNRHLWLKLRCFPTKLKIFLTNPNDNIRCNSKIILAHTVFQLLFKSAFSLKLSLLLNNFIT